MTDLNLHLRLVGATMLVLAAAHAYFPRRFAWAEETARLSLLNRQIFYVHTFFIVLILALNGSLCLFAPEALLEPTRLGYLLALGLVLFWGTRLAVQLFVYDRNLWRGRRVETTVHLLFTVLWTYYAAVFGGVLAWQMG